MEDLGDEAGGKSIREVLKGVYEKGVCGEQEGGGKRRKVEEQTNSESFSATSKNHTWKNPYDSNPLLKTLAQNIGRAVGKLHEAGVIHGDLTSSNIMVTPPSENKSADLAGGEVVIIDFGLSSISSTNNNNNSGCGRKGGGKGGGNPNAGGGGGGGIHEDRAVDLYVLERAFTSTHPMSNLSEVNRERREESGSSIEAKEVISGLDFVGEILCAYKNECRFGDSVMSRLAQVRLRGRKRECFG